MKTLILILVLAVTACNKSDDFISIRMVGTWEATSADSPDKIWTFTPDGRLTTRVHVAQSTVLLYTWEVGEELTLYLWGDFEDQKTIYWSEVIKYTSPIRQVTENPDRIVLNLSKSGGTSGTEQVILKRL